MATRIQRKRTKGWRMPENTVYVGRPTKWGNPYTLQMYADDYPETTPKGLRRLAVSDFRGLVEGRWARLEDTPSYPSVEEIRAQLADKDLCCWCPLDQPCHADVLLELANEPQGSVRK